MRAPVTDSARTRRAHNLRRIRLARGLTQAQLAHKVGVTTNAISRYENGHDDPSLTVLDALLVALECRYEDLLEDRGAAPPPRRPTRPWP